MPATLDHVLLFLVAVVQPVLGYMSFRRLLRRQATGRHINLTLLYNRTIIGQWLLFILLTTQFTLSQDSRGASGQSAPSVVAQVTPLRLHTPPNATAQPSAGMQGIVDLVSAPARPVV